MSDFYSFSIETNEGSTCMATSATRSKRSVRGGGGGLGGWVAMQVQDVKARWHADCAMMCF